MSLSPIGDLPWWDLDARTTERFYHGILSYVEIGNAELVSNWWSLCGHVLSLVLVV